jgi:DNA-binding PadR family transcriptional regulator
MHEMDSSAAISDAPVKEPHLPPMVRVGDLVAPRVPQDLAEARVEEGVLTDLAARLAYTVARFTTDWVAKQLHLSMPVVSEVLERLCQEGIIEQTLQTSQTRAHYRITDRGLEHGARMMEVCGYVGPAPVRLEAYSAMLRWQFATTPQVRPEHVAAALSGLVLTPKAAQLAGLAVSSGRSLFIYGPAGNGKSSLGRQIHAALSGDYWIPYCISVGNNVIRLFDEQIHQRVEVAGERAGGVDQRWVRIRRPLVVVGGELTLGLLDLIYSPTLRCYEAPPHLKANGGVFLVDDFGRERVSPDQLLNRFITPMEYQIDYFTLLTGQKIQVPLRHVLIIATNLNPETVTDPAFLRRMGYRLFLGPPSPEHYSRIFQLYAQRHGATATPEVIERLLERYRAQKRELRSCEPRDLIERARDICRYQGRPLELTPKVLDLAWVGYFGSDLPARRGREGEASAEPDAPGSAGASPSRPSPASGKPTENQAEPQTDKGSS